MAHKSWVFTWNNFTDDDVRSIGTWDVSRLAVGKEKAPTTGTNHLQGAVTFRTAKRLSALKKLNGGVHWEPMIATHGEAAWQYALKDGDVVYNIDNRQQGKRSDLEEVAAALAGGQSVREVAMQYPTSYMRYHAGIDKFAALAAPRMTKPRHTDTRWPLIEDWSVSHIICGPPNIGKTEWAKQHFPGGCLLVSHMDDLKAFDPKTHEGIVFDDMCFTHLHRGAQIHVTDVDNDRSIHCRYGVAFIPAHTKKIFTTNVMPIFDRDEAIDRRVRVTYLGVTDTEVTEGNTGLPSQYPFAGYGFK